ncbi:MAG: hypothetical protein MR510_08835 [Clostridium sp.]|uniref:hypothetical protein n=1 Tax=Clostridium sp. TaxID=1506 RepID=UPI002A7663AD|nr:hypothetical protein [Clostridium sp.]MCI6692567.1 hypothetical protein [Clostridium sp.]MDY2632628.1 hypothetical protein [Clostridium sp.]
MLLKKTIKYLITTLMVILSINLSSCGKSGFKNKNSYFDNVGQVDQISIQSIRDKSFKFLVTDEKSIVSMYELLSKAKVSEVKSDLQPDYIFEIKMGDEVKQYNYVVGAYEGNFYNDEASFTVSKRLDEGILQNLSIIRKPRDFEYIYYEPILDIIDKLSKTVDFKDRNVGIDIKDDVDCLKYIFSTDLENFLQKARKKAPNIEVIDNNAKDFDIIIRIKNRGHSTTEYKSNITVEDKKENTEYYYYVVGENQYKEWNINIYKEDELPKDVQKNW